MDLEIVDQVVVLIIVTVIAEIGQEDKWVKEEDQWLPEEE